MKRSLKLNPDNKPATSDQITSLRDQHEVSPISTTYGVFDCGQKSDDRFVGAIAEFDNLPTLDSSGNLTWKLADNSLLPLSKTQLTDVYTQIKKNRAVRGATLHVKAEVFRNMSPTPTVSQLKNIQFWLS